MINPAIEEDLKRMSLNDVNYADYIKENYIQIPDNATNGDMIEAMLNPYKICEYKYSVHVYMTEKDFWKSDYIMNCSASWWNEPYKAESEEV